MSDRLYRALALFDTRDGSPLANIVRAAREGYERSAPDMAEPGAWDEFDRLIAGESGSGNSRSGGWWDDA